MQKKLTAAAITIVVLIVLFSTRCGQRETMMNDGQMMEHMRNNPQMMGQMMNDTEMMQQMMARMMSDPDMMQQMMGQMMSNSDMMSRMMSNPQMMQQMAEHMSRNPEACRNMMQAIAGRMDPASAQAMIGHCDSMMGTAATGTTPSSSAASAPSSSSGAQEITVNVSGTGFARDSLNVKIASDRGPPHFRLSLSIVAMT